MDLQPPGLPWGVGAEGIASSPAWSLAPLLRSIGHVSWRLAFPDGLWSSLPPLFPASEPLLKLCFLTSTSVPSLTTCGNAILSSSPRSNYQLLEAFPVLPSPCSENASPHNMPKITYLLCIMQLFLHGSALGLIHESLEDKHYDLLLSTHPKLAHISRCSTYCLNPPLEYLLYEGRDLIHPQHLEQSLDHNRKLHNIC